MPAARGAARIYPLASLEAVAEVRFLVDGEFAETYGGTAIGRPYTG